MLKGQSSTMNEVSKNGRSYLEHPDNCGKVKTTSHHQQTSSRRQNLLSVFTLLVVLFLGSRRSTGLMTQPESDVVPRS